MTTETLPWTGWEPGARRPSVLRKPIPTTATIVDEDLTPTIVVTSAGGTLLSELLRAAREAWTIPGPLELVSTETDGRGYRTVFRPLVTEACS